MSVLFIDTEFNGFGGDLISMALVPEDDNIKPWYEVRECNITDLWVIKNVVPYLGQKPLRPLLFKSSFQAYICQFDNPTIIADWFTEPIHFCNLMSGRTHETCLSMEFSFKVVHGCNTSLISAVPHNALEDAKALKMWYLEMRV